MEPMRPVDYVKRSKPPVSRWFRWSWPVFFPFIVLVQIVLTARFHQPWWVVGAVGTVIAATWMALAMRTSRRSR